MIVSPDGDAITPLGAFAAFTAAFIGGGVVSIMLRSLGRTENAQTTVFYFTGIGTLLTAPYTLLYGSLPSDETFWLLLACGMAGVLSLLAKTQAFRYTEVAILSPINYTGIIWATLYGFVIWGDWPSNHIWFGVAIIIGSNLFILWREKRLSSKKSQDLPMQCDQ